MTKTIGFVFIEGFADWEFGLLSGSIPEWFGGRPVALSPQARPVRSIGGFLLHPERGLAPEENGDLDAVAVIGSDTWAAEAPPDPAPLLKAVHERGGLVGGICAGTLALARAGLFEQADHTSNGRDWILQHLPVYAGANRYVDTPRAVADGRIVSAPGSAPASFATAFLETLYPEQTGQIAEMRALFSREHEAA